jgi:hypothetical protein
MRAVSRTGRKPLRGTARALTLGIALNSLATVSPNGCEAGDPANVAKNSQLCDATLSNATLLSSDRPAFLVPVV